MRWSGLGLAVADERHAEVRPDLLAVLVRVAHLGLVRRDRPLSQSLNLLVEGDEVVAVRDVVDVGGEKFPLVVADDGAERGVDLEPAPVQRDDAHADGRVVEGGAEALLRLAQRPHVLLHFERVLARELGLLRRGLDVLEVGAVGDVDDEDYGRGGEEGVDAEGRDELDDDAGGGGPGEV